MSWKEKIVENKEILLVLLILTGAYILSFMAAGDVWWDAAVYIGMAKYIYSQGAIGLWEPNRPLLWPLLIGFFWKIGVDIFLAAKLLTLFFALGSVYLTYKITEVIADKKTALVAALLLGLWPIFFLYVSVLQTEIPAAFFFLWAIQRLLNKKYAQSGFLLALSFLTRFFQIFLILPLFLYLLVMVIQKKQEIKNILFFIIMFSLPVIIFLASNFLRYKNIFYPFELQSYMTQHTGWIFYQPWWYYFVEMSKENIFSIFIIPGIYFLFREARKQKAETKILFILILTGGSLPFLFAQHKEMRILIPLIPFFSVSIGICITRIYDVLEKTQKIMLCAFLSIIFLVWTLPQLHGNTYEDHLDFFYEKMQSVSENATLWISNPAFIAHTNQKASELIYYPLYNTEKMQDMEKKIPQKNVVLINSCDLLPCPEVDVGCQQ
ncbi:glycosyltransferase family 39 protein, partial [Candidatus Woesearchaeota archaeon]|nr:glycosyltransferase family 39 protein [Candidatus Woesearchaeota archaeon]